MKLHKVNSGIVLQSQNNFYHLENKDWDTFINDDNLAGKLAEIAKLREPDNRGEALIAEVQAPIASQELWASGVTYNRSKQGRQEESKGAGGGDFYGRVYEAERPELFFKATRNRIVGPGEKVRIRRDSTWNVPEPELTLVITASGKIVGYTIGNDMSSRSIEGENPLYLPQAKTYDGCAAVGPCIYVSPEPLDGNTDIALEILRGGKSVFQDSIKLNQMKRTPEELVSFLYRECSFPHGSLLMTGTGIVPPNDFNLQGGDEIRIEIPPIGVLVSTVA